MNKSFCVLAIILFFNLTSAQHLDNISSLQKSIDILKYHLKVDIDFSLRHLKCSNSITAVKSPFNRNKLELDFFNNLEIEKIISGNKYLNYDREERKIFIYISELERDAVIVEIFYNGKPRNFGFSGFVFAEMNKQKIVQTINQPNYAPSWFPCDDDPSDKALLEIEITNDSDFITASNGIKVEKIINGDKATFHYETIYPVATHLIGFYSSNYLVKEDSYTSVSVKNLNIEYYIFPKDSINFLNDVSDIKNVISTFENIFGEYPFIDEKFSLSEILLTRGAIENQTLIGIGKELFSGKKFHQEVFIHEVAHSWWGNAVGISSWKDIWLSEGFATYSVALYYEFNFGESALKSYLSKLKVDELNGRLYNPDNIFGKDVYNKGAWVLHMIRNTLSDSIFFDFIKNYYLSYRNKTISTGEFKEFLEKYCKLDFTKFFKDWIYNDFGIINCTYCLFENNAKLKLIQKEHSFSFTLEIEVIYENSKREKILTEIDSKETIIDLSSRGKIKEIILDPESKLLAKFEQVK